MGVDDENLYERCPHCNAHAYTHAGMACDEGIASLQDVITWYSRGEITRADLRLTYDSEGSTVYHLTFTRKKG